MKLSTKGRYGLRALIDLAQNGGEQPVSITRYFQQDKISRNVILSSDVYAEKSRGL